jgi:hypothetical protein
MSRFTIKSGSYCSVCKGMVLCECTHTMDSLRQALSGQSHRVSDYDALAAQLAAAERERDEMRAALEEK